MKKLLLFALAISFSLTNSSCSKKAEPAPVVSTPDYKQLILGKWMASSAIAVTTTSTGQSTTISENYNYGDVSEVFTATNFTSYAKQYPISLYPYTISGNTYTIDDGGGATRKFEIVTLNSSSFVRKITTTSGTSTTVATTTLLR
jgi:hypothetical protein